MTYEQYWYGDTDMVKSFREADRIRQKRFNSEAWLQGRYIYDAFLRVSPLLHAFAKKGTKAEDYMDEPYPIFSDGKEESQAEKEEREKQEALRAQIYMNNMIRAGKNWGKH